MKSNDRVRLSEKFRVSLCTIEYHFIRLIQTKRIKRVIHHKYKIAVDSLYWLTGNNSPIESFLSFVFLLENVLLIYFSFSGFNISGFVKAFAIVSLFYHKKSVIFQLFLYAK